MIKHEERRNDMLDMQFVRDNPDTVKKVCATKKDTADIDLILSLDAQRRNIIREVEVLKNKRNNASNEISSLKKQKKNAEHVIAEMKQVSDSIKEYDDQVKKLEEQIHAQMIKVPNIPHTSVKHGTGEKDNEVVAEWGTKPQFDFTPLDHIQIATALDLFDFPRGAKITGGGFPVYKGHGARLNRALINFMLDTHTKNGYREIGIPFFVNQLSAFGTGQLPKSKDQMYYIEMDDLYAIPTAEVPVTNLHRDEILNQDQLPVKYCAYSACFRREAGSYGKDTKGFLRVHQFDKVELVKLADPDTSYDELETLRADAEGIVRALGLSYRVVALCDADLSFAAAKCYDLEVWAPGEQKYLEVSSCSNFEDFQARRIAIKYKPKSGGKVRYVHTLNGSGLATARILVAILETYQTEQGTVRIPEALVPYMQGLREITVQ